MTELDPFEVGAHIASHLRSAQIPYAVGGALAYGIWGDPRGTHDVDVNVFVSHDELEGALDALEGAGVSIDREAARRADLEGDVLVGDYQGMRIDIFTPSIPFSWEASRTRVEIDGPHGPMSILSAEATAVFKLLFFRAKDLVDIDKMVAVQGEDLDRAYVRRWLVDMMGEDDERVESWDETCRRFPV